MPGRRLTDPSALLVSVLLHAGLLGAGTWLVANSLRNDSGNAVDESGVVEVMLLTEATGPRTRELGTDGRLSDDDLQAPRQERHLGSAGTETPRPDLPRAGRGGSDKSRERALNLADSIDGLTLNRDIINRRDRSQLQRIHTARHRLSLDDRRATPNPMQLTFVASGRGLLHERRPPSPSNPGRGLSSGGGPQHRGGQLGSPIAGEGAGWGGPIGGSSRGGQQSVLAAGVSAGVPGRGYRRSAAVVLARPAVKRARAAVPAPKRGRPNDNVNGEQEVATAVQSLIHASSAGGQLGPGSGGQQGPGTPASGALRGTGSRSTPAGRGGTGDVSHDPRFSGYHNGLLAQVNRYWSEAFPVWAIAEGRGGLAIVEMTLAMDGSLTRVRVVRQSGIPEFDRNLVAAVQRAAPFAPLPRALAPYHRVRIQFDATNPAVGRDGP